MKVLILNHNQERFGTYWRCLNIGKHLAQDHSHEVTMVCASGKAFDLGIRTQTVVENFKIVTLPRVKYSKYFTGQIFRMFLSIFQVLFMQYDVCYAFAVAQPQIGIPAVLAKKIRGKRLIIDWDDLWGGGFAEEHSSVVEKVLTFFESYIPRYADMLTYVSDFIKSRIDLLELDIPTKKIPNGSNLEQIPVLDRITSRKKLELNTEDRYLVSIGNTYTESLEIMLKAFKEVISTRKNVYLLLVGEAEIPEKYSDLIEELKENIVFVGKRPFSEVPLYLSSADCLLLPMEDNPIEKARFPMRFGDYLCAQRPIVSNAVGEVLFYLKKYNAGFISEPKDFKKMSQNILLCLDNEEAAKEVSLNARKTAEDVLRWDKVVNLVNGVL